MTTASAAVQSASTASSSNKQAATVAAIAPASTQATSATAANLAGEPAVTPQAATQTSSTSATLAAADTPTTNTARPVSTTSPKTGPAAPAASAGNASANDLTGVISAADPSFDSVLDSHATAAKSTSDAPSVATNDAKPAASPNANGTSSTAVPAQTSQTNARTEAASGTTTADGVAQSDNARFVQRVQQAFQSVGDQGGSIRLRLSPPDLGTMQIDISVQKGQLTASVQTDTAQARNLMLDNLPALCESLAQHNIKIETFNVEFTGGGAGGTSGQASQYQNQSFGNPSGGSNRNAIRGSVSTTSADAPTTSAANQNGSLNIVI